MKFKSLKSHYSFFLIILFSIFISALLAIGYFSAENIREDLSVRYGNIYSVSAKQRISSMIEEYVKISRLMSKTPLIIEWLKQKQTIENTKKIMETLDVFKSYLPEKTDVFIIRDDNLLYYLNGKHIQTLTREVTGKNIWYHRSVKQKEPFNLNIDDTTLNILKLYVNFPVRENGKTYGIVGTGEIITHFLSKILKTEDKSTFLILIDDKGLIKAHENKDLVDKKSFFDMVKNNDELLFLKNIMNSKKIRLDTNDNIYLNFNNKKHYVSVKYIKSINWYVLFFVDTNQIVKLSSFFPLLVAILISFAIFFIFVLFLTNRIVIKPIISLTNSIELISSKNFNTKLEISSNDEIGKLKYSFNKMSETIQDYTSNLEEKVKARTYELNEKNRLITDSINYAKKLQTSILPTDENLNNCFKDHFIIWQPKDIVGGDFYLLNKIDEKNFFFAVADCTGHGVPGALMSMLSASILNRIIEEKKLTDPSEILEKLNILIRQSLNIDDEKSAYHDGLEIGICYYNKEKNELRFAGAGICLFHAYENSIVDEITGDKNRIGYNFYKKKRINDFTTKEIKFSNNSMFYLCSDGYLHQDSENSIYPFGKKRFTEIIKKVYNKDCNYQKNIFEREIDTYMGNKFQRDDFTILGFKL